MLPCWRVPPESSAPFPGRRYIGSMVFHKTVMRWAPQLGSTKKRRRDAKGADEDVRILLYFYCFLVLYTVISFFVPQGTCLRAPKGKYEGLQTIFFGGLLYRSFVLCEDESRHLAVGTSRPWWAVGLSYEHIPDIQDTLIQTLKSAWKIFRDLQKPSKNETLSELGTHWWLILGSLVVPRFGTHPWPIHYWDAMKLATLPRLSMQSLRCLDWFCSVIDCRKYPGVCRWMQVSENEGILLQISILF